MTSWQSYQPRPAADLPWNDDRERRVLGGALRSWRRRAKRRRALEISAVVLAILLAGRFALRVQGTLGASRATDGASHGFAGTGGHGGAGMRGFGGSAGTG